MRYDIDCDCRFMSLATLSIRMCCGPFIYSNTQPKYRNSRPNSVKARHGRSCLRKYVRSQNTPVHIDAWE